MSNAYKAALLLLIVPSLGLAKFSSDRAPFELRIRNRAQLFDRAAVFALPGERLRIEVVPGRTPSADFEVKADSGILKRLKATEWEWQAPTEFGIHDLEVSSSAYKEDVELHAIVMEPMTRVANGYLNGYRIGNYPAVPLKNNPIYLAPKGFIEVTKDNADTRVSPHFKLEQFICKQQTTYPHYVVLNEELIVKLELILERLNKLGYSADTLHVMSGYRTPYYNKAIDNVEYSLHQWGRAADIFVDDDENGMMDDLNNDRRIDIKDATLLRDIIQQLFSEKPNADLAGGIGLYDSTPAHGPFVHVDARGYSAAW